jgi:hypothetical protein
MIRLRILLAVAVLAAVSGCAQNAPAPRPAPSVTPSHADATVDNMTEFLDALRAAGVPVSTSGEGERLTGRGVCQQLAAGANPDQLATGLASMGVWSLAQATQVVQLADIHLC